MQLSRRLSFGSWPTPRHWFKTMVEAGDLFQALPWAPAEACRLLNDIPAFEVAGVVVRVPAAWRAKRPPRAPVTATIGGGPPAGLGKDALLYLNVAVTLDGKRPTSQAIRRLLAGIDGLALIRGLRVEMDRDGLERELGRFRAASYVTVTAALK